MKVYFYILLLFSVCDCKVFTRCRLATELMKTKLIGKTFLGNFGRDLDKIGLENNSQVKELTLTFQLASTNFVIAMRYTWFTVTCVLFSVGHSKRYETRCKLVRELVKVGFPQHLYFGQWVCLIEKVSNRNTAAFVVTPSGKKFYGLYQIPARWCREGKKGGECNIACESLLDDDIRDDTACAVDIFYKEGFKYWDQWNKRCKNDNHITNEIYKCPDLVSQRMSPERTYQTEKRIQRAIEAWEKAKDVSYVMDVFHV